MTQEHQKETNMRRSFFLIIGAVALFGCASSQTAREPVTPAATEQSGEMRGGMMGQGMAGMCPMQVQGTTVSAENTQGGVALTFTTSGDAAELRRRVAHMAEMHGQHHGQGHGHGMGTHGPEASGEGGEHAHDKQHGGGHQHQGDMTGGGMMMPPAAARSEEIEGGARIILTPRDSAQVAALQEHARHMAERMASGQCPMMSTQGEAAEPAPISPEDHESHHPEGGN